MKHSQPLRLRSAHLQVCLACSLLTLSHCFSIGYFSQEHCFSESAVMKNTVCAPHRDSKLTTLMMVCLRSLWICIISLSSLLFRFCWLLLIYWQLKVSDSGVFFYLVSQLSAPLPAYWSYSHDHSVSRSCLTTLMMPRGYKGCATKTDTRAKSSRQVVLKLFRPLHKSDHPSTTKSQAQNFFSEVNSWTFWMQS